MHKAQNLFNNGEYHKAVLLLSKQHLTDSRLYERASIAIGQYKKINQKNSFEAAYVQYKKCFFGEALKTLEGLEQAIQNDILRSQIYYKQGEYQKCKDVLERDVLTKLGPDDDLQYSLMVNKTAADVYLSGSEIVQGGWELTYNRALKAFYIGEDCAALLEQAQNEADEDEDAEGLVQIQQLKVMLGLEQGKIDNKVLQCNSLALQGKFEGYFEMAGQLLADRNQKCLYQPEQYKQLLKNAASFNIIHSKFDHAQKVISLIQGDEMFQVGALVKAKKFDDALTLLGKMDSYEAKFYSAMILTEQGKEGFPLFKQILEGSNKVLKRLTVQYLVSQCASSKNNEMLLRLHKDFIDKFDNDQEFQQAFTKNTAAYLQIYRDTQGSANNLVDQVSLENQPVRLALEVTKMGSYQEILQRYEAFQAVLSKQPEVKAVICPKPQTLIVQSPVPQKPTVTKKRHPKPKVKKYDPSHVPDPERWIPKKLRKNYVARKKVNKKAVPTKKKKR